MKEFLTPEEKSRVIMFNQDEALKGAVRKIMLADIYSKGITGQSDTTNWAYNLVYGQNQNGQLIDNGKTNQELGESLRATVMGLSLLETAFKAIEKYKAEVEQPKEEANKAV